MMRKVKYGYFGILALAAVGFAACDKTETAVDEWTDISYVYVNGQTLGNVLSKDIIVVETVGVSDPSPIGYKFQVRLNRAVAQDVIVALDASVAGYVDGIKDNTMTLSAQSVTIAAGKQLSDTLTLTLDPAFMGVVDAQGTYDPTVFTVQLGAVQTGAEHVRTSTKTAKVVVTLSKKVKPYLNIASGAASGVTMDRSGWTGTLGAGVEGTIGNLFDGKTTDVAADSAPWEFTIDVGSPLEMRGVQTKHWSSSYAPTQIEVRTSSDNVAWKSQGIYSTSGSTQNWRFIAPVTARYLKYILIAPNKRTDVTEFNITGAN